MTIAYSTARHGARHGRRGEIRRSRALHGFDAGRGGHCAAQSAPRKPSGK